jgi:hypothetical protein
MRLARAKMAAAEAVGVADAVRITQVESAIQQANAGRVVVDTAATAITAAAATGTAAAALEIQAAVPGKNVHKKQLRRFCRSCFLCIMRIIIVYSFRIVD